MASERGLLLQESPLAGWTCAFSGRTAFVQTATIILPTTGTKNHCCAYNRPAFIPSDEIPAPEAPPYRATGPSQNPFFKHSCRPPGHNFSRLSGRLFAQYPADFLYSTGSLRNRASGSECSRLTFFRKTINRYPDTFYLTYYLPLPHCTDGGLCLYAAAAR